MKLYDHPLSSNCRKVRAVAYELGIDLEYVRVDLFKGESHTPAFLAKNPNGRVPVLEDGDFVLWESIAIMRYLTSKHTGPTSLIPSDLRGRADVDRWLAWQLAHLSPAMGKVAYERVVKKLSGRGTPDQARIDEGTAEFATLTRVLDESLEGKEYVAGPLTLADFALASHYAIASTAGLDVGPYSRVSAWLSRVVSRESMKRALADAREWM